MKGDKALWSSICILIGLVIMILSLLRGTWLIAALLLVFTSWAAWVVYCLLLPSMKAANLKRRRMQNQRKRQQEGLMSAALQSEPIALQKAPNAYDINSNLLLLRHVNHRISAHLRAAYPDISWEWCEEHPELLAANGGIGRIKVYGVPDFTHADIRMDRNANIQCSMIKAVPLDTFVPAVNSETPAPKKRIIDPQIWYELSGRKVLETVVADLNSRSYSSLTINEDGEICIQQEDKLVPQEQLKGFPEKLYWPRVVEVFMGHGLAAEITDQGVQLSW